MNKTNADETKALYQIIGNITVTWSLLERGLDHIALTIFKACGGNSIKKRVSPQLEPKLDFIRTSFQTLPDLKELKTKGIEIVDRVKLVSGRRHELIHGAVSSLYPIDGVIVFTKYEFNKERAKLKSVSFSPQEFHELIQDVERLAYDTALLDQNMQKTYLSPK